MMNHIEFIRIVTTVILFDNGYKCFNCYYVKLLEFAHFKLSLNQKWDIQKEWQFWRPQHQRITYIKKMTEKSVQRALVWSPIVLPFKKIHKTIKWI